MRRYARPLLAVLFVALLATPWMIRTWGPRAPTAESAEAARHRHGFRLTEAGKTAGLDFVHGAPTLDPALAHIMPQVASMGAAVSVVDVDADGRPDLYVVNSREGSRNHLYRNRGDGTFEEIAGALGLAALNEAATGVSMGSAWGDYDNDGYPDLLLHRWGRQDLFHNEQGRSFTRVETADLPAWANINAATWLDFDRDGRLDLFLGGYFAESVNLWSLSTTRMMPESFEYATNGGRKYLYRNLGHGRFEEVSAARGLTSTRWALAVVAADLRGTGYPDLFIANDYGVSELFVNDRGFFREVGRQTGVGYAPKSGMNASVGDVLNQGRFAIYVSNISEEGILIQGNNLWVPTGGDAGALPAYENLARAMNVDLGGWSFGAQFGDLNNDGELDLYLVNGYVSASRTESYWYDYSKVAGGHEIVIADARHWPPMGARSLAGYQASRVWVNDGAGRFVDVAPLVGVTDRYDGRAVALADFSNRGALDVVVANQRGPLLLYRNEVAPDRGWVAFELEGACRPETPPGQRCSNRDAIGAQVTLYWGGRQQVQEVLGNSGFCAQNQRRLHFGLGNATQIDRAVIRWPSGKVQDVPAPSRNRVHVFKEAA